MFLFFLFELMRFLRILTCLLLAALLAGCAGVETETPETAAEPAVSAPVPLALQPFSSADSAAMSSYICRSRWLLEDKTLYGLDFDGQSRPGLYEVALRRGRPASFRLLVPDCEPEYLCRGGDWLYYLNAGVPWRCRPADRVREKLADGPWRSLQFFDGALYYTDAQGRLWRCEPDGSGGELLLAFPCDYAWVMPEGVLFQSEDEGCFLKFYVWDGELRQLSAAASYAPLRLGDTVWYAQYDRVGSALACVDLADGLVRRVSEAALHGEIELIPTPSGWQLRFFPAERDWAQRLYDPKSGTVTDCSYSGYRLCDGTDGKRRIDAAYEADGRLRCFILVDADGSETAFLRGDVLEEGG